MEDLPERQVIAMQWSLDMMVRAFRDLAASFATLNPELADEAVKRTEMMVAHEMDRFIKKPPEGVTVDVARDIVAAVVPPFREMTQGARAMIQQAGKPKH